MNTPPDYVIEAAREAATRSPCNHSKRGAVAMLHDPNPSALGPQRPVVAARGWNGQPKGFACDGSKACETNCAKLCMHAEQRAVVNALRSWPTREASIDIVHVKVVDGDLVPGKGPCCEQCSKLILDVGMRGIWLFQRVFSIDHTDGSPSIEPLELLPRWQFYPAEQFHRLTLMACGLPCSPESN